jgi:hypothetical protein
MLTVCFDCEGIIRNEFLPHGQTVNKEFYLRVMKRLREAVRRKMPDLWRGKKLLHHYDNALVHLSNLICGFVTKHETMLVLEPPYLPDLALEDFFLYTKLKLY